MKTLPKNYALGLYEAIKTLESKTQIQGAIKNFILILKKERALYLIPKIISAFEKIYKKENGIIDIEVTTKNEIDFNTIIKNLGNKLEIKKKIDSNIIGGLILKYEDNLIDGSLKKKLEILKEGFKNG